MIIKKIFISVLFTFLFASISLAQDSTVYKLNSFFEKINNTDFSYLRVIKKLNDSTWEQFDYIRGGNPYQRTLFKDSDLKIRHGVYTRYENRGKTFYSGHYKDNEPVGSWYFYSLKNNTVTDSLNYSFYADMSGFTVKSNGTDEGSEFPGGTKAWKKYLNNNMGDMETAELIGKKKKDIVISFTIGSGGKLIDVNPVKSIHPEVDLEVVKIIRRSPPWKVDPAANKNSLQVRIQKITF